MNLSELYYVKEVENRVARDFVVKYHYLHRAPSASKSYGLFSYKTLSMIGAMTFGKGGSFTLMNGICGEDEAKNVVELTRLYIHDVTPKNTETWFISQVFKLLPYEIIVSFADPVAGHTGIIYRAANFMYTGLGSKGYELALRSWLNPDGTKKAGAPHCRELWYDGCSNQKLRDQYGDELVTIKKVPKHRYIYFNTGSKGRRRELMQKLRYKPVPFPKDDKRLKVQIVRESLSKYA